MRNDALLIRPLPPIVEDPPEELPEGGQIIALVDCEATSLDPKTAAIIELAIMLVAIDAHGNVIGHTGPASWLEDPGEPLSDDVQRVTRLCDEALAGQKIDEQLAIGMLQRASLIIGHNASYDAVLLERRLPQIAGMPWACSVREVPWLYLGLDGRQQGYLLVQHSWHNFAAHRAAHDVWGLFHLLQCRGSIDGGEPRMHLQRLLETSTKPTVRLSVQRSFEVKDQLKARGFRYEASDKIWWVEVAEDQVETMKAELARLGAAPPIERIITATERHRPLRPDYARLAENRRRFDEIDTSDPW